MWVARLTTKPSRDGAPPGFGHRWEACNSMHDRAAADAHKAQQPDGGVAKRKKPKGRKVVGFGLWGCGL
jgi:hypothetical protein